MNKTYGFFIFVLAFTGFLAGQVFFNRIQLTASPLSKEKSKASFYEAQLKKLQGKTSDGTEIKASDIKAPVVILNFWASWCVPCLQEFPSLVALQKQFGKKKVFVLGINSDEENVKKNINKIYKKYNLNFPSILDEGKISSLFNINNLPASLIFIDGKLHKTHIGVTDFMEKELVTKIKAAVKSKS